MSREANPAQLCPETMTKLLPAPPASDPVGWLTHQPYLLLSLTSLFWAGNIVLARYVAGHVPPMTLSCITVGRRVRHVAAVRVAASAPRLAGPAGAAAADGGAVGDGICRQQRAGLLGPAVYHGTERPADPVVRAAVRGAVVADAVRRSADLGAARRHRHLACRRSHHHPARRFRRAGRHPAQQGRRDADRSDARIRIVFGADAAPAEDASIIADRLHHRRRRVAAAAVLDLGIFERRQARIRRPDGRDPALCHDLPVDAGVSVLQPRHRADRAEPRRAVLSPDAGIRLGDGDPAARRTAAAVPSGRLSAGARGRGDRLAAGDRPPHRYAAAAPRIGAQRLTRRGPWRGSRRRRCAACPTGCRVRGRWSARRSPPCRSPSPPW